MTWTIIGSALIDRVSEFFIRWRSLVALHCIKWVITQLSRFASLDVLRSVNSNTMKRMNSSSDYWLYRLIGVHENTPVGPFCAQSTLCETEMYF